MTAKQAYDKQHDVKIRDRYVEQFNKSYMEGFDDMVSAPKPQTKPIEEKTITTLVPQLLNPIEMSELGKYIADDNYLMQQKLDGKRVMVSVDFGLVTASNRRSWEIGIPAEIATELRTFDDCELDGELIGSVYHVFDVLSHKGKDLRQLGSKDRFDYLIENIIGNRRLYQVDIVQTAFDTESKQQLADSLVDEEGVVFKQINAPYSVGRPNKGGPQLKCKFWATATCVVTGINSKRSVEISVSTPDEPYEITVGNATIPPNYPLPNLGDLVEIKYLYAYKNGSLFQPQYQGVRDDIEAADWHDTLKFKSEDEDED
jgi:bifunctional non-homologous end joining protein LigD